MRDPLAPALAALRKLTIERLSAAESLARMETARKETERDPLGEPRVRIVMGPLEVALEVMPSRGSCIALALSRTSEIATSDGATIDIWRAGDVRSVAAREAASLAFDGDGNLWWSDGQAIYRMADGKDARMERVMAVDGPTTFSADGSFHASMRGDAIVVTHEGGSRAFSIDDEPSWFALSPSGDRLVTADDAFVMVFDTDSGAMVSMLRQRAATVSFLPNPRMLITGSREGITVWDLALRRPEQVLATGGEVRSLALSPDRRWLLACVESRAEAWHLQEGRRMGSCALDAPFDRCLVADDVLVTTTAWLRWRNTAAH